MVQPIDRLEQELWGYCVFQRAPNGEEMIKRWQTDEVAHLKERFVVREMPPKLRPLVQEAILQWEGIEDNVLSNLQMDKQTFLRGFKRARQNFLNGNNEWADFVASVRSAVQGAVKNMDWVNLFSWVLPRADPTSAEKYQAIGEMVTAIFYIELLSKYSRNPGKADNSPLNRIEARWTILNSGSPQGPQTTS